MTPSGSGPAGRSADPPVRITADEAEERMRSTLVIAPPARGERPLQIIAFGLDELLVRRQDEDGFAHLTLFAIERIAR